MARFDSLEEALRVKQEATQQIDEILNKDLYPIEESKRSIDMWMQTYGKDPEQRQSKQLLSSLEMNAVDAEIHCLHLQSMNHSISLEETLA
jgi:hypothetical protein